MLLPKGPQSLLTSRHLIPFTFKPSLVLRHICRRGALRERNLRMLPPPAGTVHSPLGFSCYKGGGDAAADQTPFGLTGLQNHSLSIVKTHSTGHFPDTSTPLPAPPLPSYMDEPEEAGKFRDGMCCTSTRRNLPQTVFTRK